MDENTNQPGDLYQHGTWRSRIGPIGFLSSSGPDDLPPGSQGVDGIPLFHIPPIITKQEKTEPTEGRILELD